MACKYDVHIFFVLGSTLSCQSSPSFSSICLIGGFIHAHAQCGWDDESNETVPEMFLRPPMYCICSTTMGPLSRIIKFISQLSHLIAVASHIFYGGGGGISLILCHFCDAPPGKKICFTERWIIFNIHMTGLA